MVCTWLGALLCWLQQSQEDKNSKEQQGKGIGGAVSELVTGTAEYAQKTAVGAYEATKAAVASTVESVQGTVHDKAKEKAQETEKPPEDKIRDAKHDIAENVAEKTAPPDDKDKK